MILQEKEGEKKINIPDLNKPFDENADAAGIVLPTKRRGCEKRSDNELTAAAAATIDVHKYKTHVTPELININGL